MKKLIMAGLAMACAVAYCDAAKTSKDSKDSKEISAAAAAKKENKIKSDFFIEICFVQIFRISKHKITKYK